MVQWKDSYSVGNLQIDAQHRQLLAMCQQCEELLETRGMEDNSRIHLLLNDLSEYVRSHFDYEESLLRQHGYPKLLEHIAEHNEYWEQLANILAKASSGRDERDDVRRLLQQWWMHHILEVDMQYRSCVTGQE